MIKPLELVKKRSNITSKSAKKRVIKNENSIKNISFKSNKG